MLFRSLFVASLLALSTNAWANDLTNLERVHHVGAISQTQKSLLDAWSEGRALQLESVFGSYYLVLGKDGSALDKGWAATLPGWHAATRCLSRSAEDLAKDFRWSAPLPADQRGASSLGIAGFGGLFPEVFGRPPADPCIRSGPQCAWGRARRSRAMNALADTLCATPTSSTKSLKGETNDPLLDSQWHHAWIGSRAAWDISQGSAEIVIAIIDSGVDMEHPSFEGKPSSHLTIHSTAMKIQRLIIPTRTEPAVPA